MLTDDMKRVVEEQRLGFVATVCPNGTPNLSPKGTTTVWDDETLMFADIRSPQTVANLLENPAIEINVVDPISRKGYRFKGTGIVLREGTQFDELLAFYRARGTNSPIKAVVLVKIERALPLISPAYDNGATEDEIRANWRAHFNELDTQYSQGRKR